MDNLLHKLKLSTGKRWYIEFYQLHPVENRMIRVRETYNLNRLKNKKERKIYAYKKLIELKELIPLGYPWSHDIIKKNADLKIRDGLDRALKLKAITASRSASRPSYKSAVKLFSTWLSDQSLIDGRIQLIDTDLATSYLDHIIIDRCLSKVYRNNQLEYLRSLFNCLVDKKMIYSNPFKGIKDLKIEAKIRKPINEIDKTMIIDKINKTDQGLLFAVLLLYYCFIRPAEVRRLKVGDIDLAAGVIRISGSQAKNKRSEVVTIPDRLSEFIRDSKYLSYPGGFYLLGKDLRPHADTMIGKNTIGNRHRAIVRSLKLTSPESITLYSWKDTGVINLINNGVNLETIRKQLRHKDLNTTQIYCQGLSVVSDEIKLLDDGLIGD